MADANMLGQVAIGQVNVAELFPDLLIDAPAHDAHLRGIAESPLLTRNLMLLVGPVNEVMARLAKRDEIGRAIPASFS